MTPANAVRLLRRPALGLALVGWLMCTGGCRVGPDYWRPPAPVAPVWHETNQEALIWHAADVRYWWTDFDDPQLVRLIELTAEQNFTLREALQRIDEARASRSIVRGDLFPDFDGKALYARRQFSQNGNPFSLVRTSPFDFFQAGFDATWELDIWGKYRRSLEAADAQWDEAIDQYHAVQVSLLAETAANYVQLRTYQQRMAIALANAQLQADTVRFIESRVNAGLKQELALAQANANLFETRASVPAQQLGIQTAINRLCVLRGQPPQDLLLELGDTGTIPATHAEIGVGVPASLLRRRPDILAAERRVASESARIGVAVAELYPQLSLLGTVEVNSHDLARWFTGESLASNYGPSFRWNILNFGRVRSNIGAQQSRHEQAISNYQQTVLTAAEEVENAMSGYVLEQQRVDQLQRAVDAAGQAVRLADARYRQRLIEFLDVLQTQRNLLDLQDQWAVSQGNVALQRIAIYKALGGGWHGAQGDIQQHIIVRVAPEELPVP